MLAIVAASFVAGFGALFVTCGANKASRCVGLLLIVCSAILSKVIWSN